MRHVLLALLITVNGCSERPIELGSADYPYNTTPAHCVGAIPTGAVGIHNDEKTPTGIKYSVRTPSNYDPESGHPLLMVYPGAGQSRFAAEAFTGLTTAATDAGFIVAYSDHRPLSVPVIEDLARIPRAIAEKWCVDENRVYLTGQTVFSLQQSAHCLVGLSPRYRPEPEIGDGAP